MSWNAKMVLQMVGIEPKEADEFMIFLAEMCVERCYYLDRAAEQLAEILRSKK